MAKQTIPASAEPAASTPALVRVRLKPGATIKISRTRLALGGEWVEITPEAFASVRPHVETAEEIAQAQVRAAKPEAERDPSRVAAQFEQFRAAALRVNAQHKAAQEQRAAAAEKENG